MNSKLLSAGAGLFGFGALISWALTADHFDKKNRDEIESRDYRIYMLRNEVYRLKTQLDDVEMSFAAVDMPTGEEKSPGGDSDENSAADDEVDEAKVEETRTNLQRLIDEYKGDPDSSSAEYADRAVEFDNDKTPPFVISRDKYAWDDEIGDGYTKLTHTYYRRHRVVVDEDGEAVEDVANVLGWKNLTMFGHESGDEDTVFIRNPKLRSDFEVVLEHEKDIPLHIKYGMGREEFETGKAAGLINLRPEDRG